MCQKAMVFIRMNISRRRRYFLTRLYKNYIYLLLPHGEFFLWLTLHNLLENPLLFPTEITNLLFVIKTRQPLKQNFLLNCKQDYDKEKRMVISIAFCDFALWNSDHRNLGLVFPKFLFFWAEWNA